MADEVKFYVGTVVSMNSGGPKMTVKAINPESGDCWCWWFNTDNELKNGFFSPAMLIVAKDLS